MGPTSRGRQSRSVRVTPEADPRSAELGHNRKAGWDSALKRNFQHFSSVADEGVANESGWEWGSEGSLEGCRLGCGVMEPMGPGMVPTLAEERGGMVTRFKSEFLGFHGLRELRERGEHNLGVNLL